MKTEKPAKTKEQRPRTYHPPPEGVGEGLEVVVYVLLHQVHEKRREDETQKAYVDCGQQFLKMKRGFGGQGYFLMFFFFGYDADILLLLLMLLFFCCCDDHCYIHRHVIYQ